MLLLILVLLLLAAWLIRRMRWAARVNQVPGMGESRFGLTGDVFVITSLITSKDGHFNPMQNVLRILQGHEMIVENKGLFRIWIGPVPHLFIKNADYIEAVLGSNELITKGFQYKFLHPWLGMGLLTSKGDKWRAMRKLLTPSFHFRILEQFVPVMSKNGRILVRNLEQEASRNGGIVADLAPFILLCALDVICETAMGESINAQSNRESKYIKAVHTMSDIVMERSFRPLIFSDLIFSLTPTGRRQREALHTMHSFTDKVIRSRKAQLISNADVDDPEDGSRRKEPFMDTLLREHLKSPKELTELNIREEVDTFMFEGHDTTAWGVIWSTYLLGLYPDCQQRVQDEVDTLFAGKSGDDEDLTLDEMRSGLPYTEAVVKEAQRLFPSVPLFSRQVTKETQVGDYTVPAGAFFVVVPTLVHQNPKYWEDPMRFHPERFLSRERQHPYAFVPFSAGPRNCIGQKFAMLEEKALIAKIFRKFRVTSLDQRDCVIPAASLILKSNVPIRVRLQPR